MSRELATETKSRYEIIIRGKLSWSEAGARTSLRSWVDRELREIGLAPLTDDEMRVHNISATPRLL